MIASSRQALTVLGCINFLFITSYSILGVHALFLHQNDVVNTNLREATILGMALFSGTQVGGVWLLSLVHDSLTSSRILLWSFRLLSAVLLSLPYSATIILGMFLFGLSHSIFYVQSRALLAKVLEQFPEASAKGYALFGITTNLSFLSMPIIGGYILGLHFGKTIVVALSTLTTIFALALLEKVNFEMGTTLLNKQSKKNNTVSNITNFLSKDNCSYVVDIFRFLGFILPYAIMMAIIPLRFSEAGWSAKKNSYMIALNGVIVILFQIFYFMRGKKEFTILYYDRVSWLAAIIFMASLFSPIEILVPLFIVWCFCEAYQLPSIEYHIFSRRKYSGRLLNQILAIDAVVCFFGPFLAEKISTKYFMLLINTVFKSGA